MEKTDQFIKINKTRLQTVLDKFQWTTEGVLNDFNTNSKHTSLNFHESSIVNNEEPLFPTSIMTSNSTVLAECELQKLLNNPEAKVPQKFSDLQMNFNREEKLLLYENTTKQRTELDPLCLQEDIISLADIVAMKKLEKKKRRKYRTSKPSFVEELHSLLEIQMQALEQYFETKFSSKHESKCKVEKTAEGQKSENKSFRYQTEKETHSAHWEKSVQKTHESERCSRRDNSTKQDYSYFKRIQQDSKREKEKSDLEKSVQKIHESERYSRRDNSVQRDYSSFKRIQQDSKRETGKSDLESQKYRRRSRSRSQHKHENRRTNESHRRSRSRSRRKHKSHHKRSRSRSHHRSRSKKDHKSHRSKSKHRH